MSNRPMPEPGQMYRHFKGGLYKIIGIGKHSETQELLVIYCSKSEIWVRPLDNFLEILGDKSEGTSYYRFQLVDSPQ